MVHRPQDVGEPPRPRAARHTGADPALRCRCNVVATLRCLASGHPRSGGTTNDVGRNTMTVYAPPGSAGLARHGPEPLRPLHRRRVGRAEEGRVLREHLAGQRQAVHRGRPRHRRGHRGRARRRPRGRPRLGQARRPPSARLILNRIADRIEENLEMLAVAETWDNGKPVRETLAADLPLAVDHFRYFAGVPARPGGHQLARSTRTPWPTTSTSRSVSSARSSPGTSRSSWPTWKLAPALAAGNASCSSPPSRPRGRSSR